MSNLVKRQEIERKIVCHLIRTMKAAGWDATAVDNGEGWESEGTETGVIENVFSVDESWIRFVKTVGTNRMLRTAQLVLGNDGWDCIADHSLSNTVINGDDFEKVMTEQVDPYCAKLGLET